MFPQPHSISEVIGGEGGKSQCHAQGPLLSEWGPQRAGSPSHEDKWVGVREATASACLCLHQKPSLQQP